MWLTRESRAFGGLPIDDGERHLARFEGSTITTASLALFENTVSQILHEHHFANGLTLIVEPMPWLESVAFSLTLPGGAIHDPADRLGLSNLTNDMVQRGGGELDSRAFTAALDNLGVVFSSNVTNSFASFAGAMPADQLTSALPLYADMLRRPQLPIEKLDEAKLVCIQEIRAAEDDLAQRVLAQLRKRRYPHPFGREPQGEMAAIEAATMADVTGHYANCYGPGECVMSVAGNVDWPALRSRVEELFGDWQPQSTPRTPGAPPETDYLHIEHGSSQTHIGISFPIVPYRDPSYYRARAAIGVLSDGMSSRLFTELREERGLCYAVFASYHSLPELGSVQCYVGTTTEHAQESLDVMIDELTRLGDGVAEDELERLRARFKSGLIMQQESSTSRAASMGSDWRLLGRVRSMEEISQAINDLNSDSINEFLTAHRPTGFQVVSLGAKRLEMPVGVS